MQTASVTRVTIHAIEWDLAAAVVEQPPLGVLRKQARIQFAHNGGEQA